MEVFLKEHKEDNYGKVVNMSSLFAAVMLSLGKATKKPAGAKIGDLYWCNLGRVVIKTGEVKEEDKTKSVYHIYEEDSEIMKKEKVETETSYNSPLKNSIVFIYENINNVEKVKEDETYVIKEQPLINVLRSNHLWKKDWDEETYLTNDCLDKLNSTLYYNHYKRNMNRNTEISV